MASPMPQCVLWWGVSVLFSGNRSSWRPWHVHKSLLETQQEMYHSFKKQHISRFCILWLQEMLPQYCLFSSVLSHPWDLSTGCSRTLGCLLGCQCRSSIREIPLLCCFSGSCSHPLFLFLLPPVHTTNQSFACLGLHMVYLLGVFYSEEEVRAVVCLTWVPSLQNKKPWLKVSAWQGRDRSVGGITNLVL